MRDLVAALVAVLLLLVAFLLMAALRSYRSRRARRYAEAARSGRRIVAEIPTDWDLVLFAEDAGAFYLGDRVIEKAALRGVRVLVNGAPLASVGTAPPAPAPVAPADPGARGEAAGRDRWDVAIDTTGGTVLVACGALGEQVSQEIALRVYDAVARALSPPSPFDLRHARPAVDHAGEGEEQV